jgi:hypothetical protein
MLPQKDQVMLNLSAFRKNLRQLMDPKILSRLAEFLEKTGYEDSSMIERFDWFCHNSTDGVDCKYAVAAKEFFLQNQAADAAAVICWLYHNWARTYETKE